MMTGLEPTLALAKKAGIDSPLRKFPATFLGSSEVTLMEMTLANTIFPNGGWRPDKHFIITKIEDKNGRVVYRAEPKKVGVDSLARNALTSRSAPTWVNSSISSWAVSQARPSSLAARSGSMTSSGAI